MEVIEWIDYDAAIKLPENALGVAPTFDKEKYPTRELYEKACEELEFPYYQAFKKSVIDNDIKEGGDWHQNNKNGVPLFSDNTVSIFFMRAWDATLSKIWSEHENKDIGSYDFYMSR